MRARPRDALGISPSDLRAPGGAESVEGAPPPADATPLLAGLVAAAPTAAPLPRPEERRAQRAARRHRRQLALWCAVLIAFCLAVTILIVVMAGNRTPGPQAVTSLPSASASPAVPLDPSARRSAAVPT